ncbi:MAG TPA: lipase family protein [Candidatus Xenobia bacterium]|jgi:hypothetical protein
MLLTPPTAPNPRVFVPGKLPQLPLPDILNAWDSKTTARVIDRVDVGTYDPTRTASQGNAAILTALATAAYATPQDQAAHFKLQPGVRSFVELDSADNARLGIPVPDYGTQASVINTGNTLIVAFRGTQPPWLQNLGKNDEFAWNDLVADLNTVPVQNYDGTGLVHEGFKHQADAIWDQLKPYLSSAVQSHQTIVFCGHSLGAAVALDEADKMHHEMGLLPKTVLRLGGPTVGWGDEEKHLSRIGLGSRTINVQDTGDPIPLLPPGGQEVGTDMYIDHHGTMNMRGGAHWVDRGITEAVDTATGHNLMPLYRHFWQFYINGVEDPRNTAAWDRVERRLG